MKWEIKNIEDESYFKIGSIFGGFDEPQDRHKELVVSNSFLKKVYETNLHDYLLDGNEEIGEDLQEIFDIGSSTHCFVLENKFYNERYRVSDTIDASDERVRIGLEEFKFMESVYLTINKKYPYIADNQNAEITIMGELDGVNVKAKIDKLHIESVGGRFTRVEIIDLKSTYLNFFKLKKSSAKDRWELRKKFCDLGYSLQAFFYTKLVTEWLHSIGQTQCEVVFSFVVASKDTFQVQKFIAGSEMMIDGEERFNSVWSDVRSFVLYGKDSLINEEVL